MIEIEFSAENKAELEYERFHHPHPRVQMKMEALWLKSQCVTHHVITQLVGVSANTLRSYLREYKNGGIEGLRLDVQVFQNRRLKPLFLVDRSISVKS
jgi:Homeodomain-like domain